MKSITVALIFLTFSVLSVTFVCSNKLKSRKDAKTLQNYLNTNYKDGSLSFLEKKQDHQNIKDVADAVARVQFPKVVILGTSIYIMLADVGYIIVSNDKGTDKDGKFKVTSYLDIKYTDKLGELVGKEVATTSIIKEVQDKFRDAMKAKSS